MTIPKFSGLHAIYSPNLETGQAVLLHEKLAKHGRADSYTAYDRRTSVVACNTGTDNFAADAQIQQEVNALRESGMQDVRHIYDSSGGGLVGKSLPDTANSPRSPFLWAAFNNLTHNAFSIKVDGEI